MLHRKVTSEIYQADFVKKFSNFCEKSPVLLSFVKSDQKVTIIHTNTAKQYDFEWDYLVPVKKFIFDIKQVLVKNHYPRLVQVVKEKIPLTPQEQALLLEAGTTPANLPSYQEKATSTLWRIDRVIVYKDSFILVNEETDEQYRYRLLKSCIHFLKKYRGGGFSSLEAAGDYFFQNSVLVNKIIKRSDESED